jgi:hypothetical protein
MKPDYMSSEDSEIDDLDDKIVKYNVRKLPWESRALRKVKRKLDKLHTASLSDLVQKRLIPREGGQLSIRPKPKDCPEWAALAGKVLLLSASDTSVNSNDSFSDILNDS